MKRREVFTEDLLKQRGFVEYELDKFGPAARVTEIEKTVTKKRKKAKGEKEQRFDPFMMLCEIELKVKPVPEYKFSKDRKWRMDYAFIKQMVFLEVEGGVWTNGRHTRGKGFIKDMEKYNEAAAQGWSLIRCVPSDLVNGKAIKQLKQIIK
ncbi:MAG TPA: hypothetical protein VGN20_19225 [Mucilaginibacter sp.]|jgi:hypothetical protein